jgi:hypothetical protein
VELRYHCRALRCRNFFAVSNKFGMQIHRSRVTGKVRSSITAIYPLGPEITNDLGNESKSLVAR